MKERTGGGVGRGGREGGARGRGRTRWAVSRHVGERLLYKIWVKPNDGMGEGHKGERWWWRKETVAFAVSKNESLSSGKV